MCQAWFNFGGKKYKKKMPIHLKLISGTENNKYETEREKTQGVLMDKNKAGTGIQGIC